MDGNDINNEINNGDDYENIKTETQKENDVENAIVVKEISGKRTYKTGEVAKMLGETPAMIGHYCREFEEHLGLQHTPGQHRSFSEENIKILEYIIYLLKTEGMTVEQAKEFLSTPQGKLLKPLDNKEDRVQMFVELITNELKSSIETIVRSQVETSLKNVLPTLVKTSMDSISTVLIEQQSNVENSIKTFVNEGMSSLEKITNVVQESNKNVEQSTSILTEVEQRLVELREQKFKSSNDEKGGLFGLFRRKSK